MKIKKKNLIIAISGAVILLLAACSTWGYLRYAAPTRILLVNYPEYMLAPLLDQPPNPALDIQAIHWNDQSGEELRNADCIIFFGMGLNFTAEQQKLISELDVPMYTTSSTRSETALKKMPPEHLENIQAYLNGGGKANFKNMLDYIRYHLDGKRINAPRPAPPQKFERKKYFHIDEKDSFATFAEYSQWYRSSGRFNADNATVLILGGNGGGSLGDLIEALEKRRLNVVSAHGMWPVGQDIDAIAPDLVIYQPHGRLGDEAVEYLKKRNIPLFCPIKVNQPYEEYLKDQRGMTGGMLSQSITMPELDGGCVPFVLSALFRNERGLLEFRMIPDRLERFADLVKKTTLLKTKPNSEKKIAIIYYGSIGKESATAGLGTAESLLNILRYLQQNNYNTGTLPASVEALDREIKANTAIFGKLNGSQTPNSRLVSTVTVTGREYEQWVKKSMPSDLYSTVVERYGAFPGRTIFRTPEGNMRLGCIRFGNVVLMPQSLPGEGASENKLIHGVKFSPPHTYIATYLYLQHGFQADAIMHLGTHGSLEFTPWKQAALSSYDWPDVLIGSMPHYYLYIINNIGEAEIAKRRSYAAMLSHLTPPFMNSEAYGPIAALQEKLHAFEIADNPRLKAEYGKSIIELVKKENYHRDLQLSDQLEKGVLTEEDMLKLQQYLHEISDAKVNRGIYIIGRPYTLAEANETARLMTVDAIAEKLFLQDLAAGKVAASQRQDKAFFRANYLKKAHTLAENVLQNTPPEAAEAILRQASKPSPAHPQKNIDPEAMQKMIASGKLPDGRTMPPEMMQAMKQMNMSPEAMRKRTHQARPAAPVELTPEVMVLKARADLLQSTDSELASILNAFNGGYITAGPGGDPILNPATVPTGKNLYGIDPERTPSKESYAVGKQLAEELIQSKLRSSGKYPEKVAFSLWGGEFIRTQGVNVAQIFYLLGVEPVWDSRGRVQDVRLIPMSELKRPRIDVVIQTSGQFRSAAASRMKLIDKAVMLAATDPDGEFGNYVRSNSQEITRVLIAQGMSPNDAKQLANARIFGGVNGNFGTGAMGMAQATGQWEDSGEIAELYLNNMGAIYTEGHWGEHNPEMFKAAIRNTDTVVQSRSSNSWGPLSLDHVYEFTGGLSLVSRHVNGGKDPEAFFNDLRTPGAAKVQSAREAAMVEAHSTVLNPKYISEMMQEGAAATGHFQEVFRNTLGWEIMKPDMLEDHLWQQYKDVYVDDKHHLGVKTFFEQNNPAALQDMTGVMLEAIRKDFWQADEQTTRQIVDLHVKITLKHDLPPTDNPKLQAMIQKYLSDPELRKSFEQQVQKAAEARKAADKIKATAEVNGMQLKAQTPDRPEPGDTVMALKVIGAIIAAALSAIITGNIIRRRKRK